MLLKNFINLVVGVYFNEVLKWPWSLIDHPPFVFDAPSEKIFGIKVSGNPCDDHNLTSIVWKKKFPLHLVHFMPNFELQLQKATKFFGYFWLQLVRLKSSKKPCPRFLITFLLFEILANITFLFPLKSVLKIENPS